MLMIRKITKNDQLTFQKFCCEIGTHEVLEDSILYFGVFDGLRLQGYTKVYPESLPRPFLSDIETLSNLESTSIEGLLRGTLNYCYIHMNKHIIISDINWLKDYLAEALEIVEKNSYNNTNYHTVNLETFFNKSCKGGSMCP